MPTIVKDGVLPDAFSEEEKVNLIVVSVKGIASACLNQSSINWPLFAKRMTKMERFLITFPSSHAIYTYLASSYVEATRLLYSNGQGDSWFTKGEAFSKEVTSKFKGNKADLSGIWTQYGNLLSARFEKTGNKAYQVDRAIEDCSKAIGLDPNDAEAYAERGMAYRAKGDNRRAMADFEKVIGIDPKDKEGYAVRADAYRAKGDCKHAFADFRIALGLNPQ